MIKQFREYAESKKKEVELMLSAKDSDFIVETYIGVYAMRNKKLVLE